MTREEMINSLEDILMLEEGELNLEQNLTEYEDWDSMSYLALIALFDSRLKTLQQNRLQILFLSFNETNILLE